MPWWTAGYLVAAALAVWVLRRLLLLQVTIYPYQRGLLYRRGRFHRVLEPGQYWFYKPAAHVTLVDMRRKTVVLPGQEMLTRENVSVKVSLVAEVEVADPEAAEHRTPDVETALYSLLQVALRQAVAGLSLEELLSGRSVIADQVLESCRPPAAELGLRLHSVGVRDLMLPSDLKKAFAEVIKAQKEGQAALERARGETAALRSLANAARMTADQPMLLQLRLLQSLGQGGGHTVVMGSGAPGAPVVPVRQG